VTDELSKRLVPDELWALAEPLLPEFSTRPQGGGTAPVDERAVFTAVVFVLTSGCVWRMLPPSFGVSVPTAHRRFTVWTEAGLWRRLHRAVLDELGSHGLIDWSRAVIDAASVQAKKGGTFGPGRARSAVARRVRRSMCCPIVRESLCRWVFGRQHQ